MASLDIAYHLKTLFLFTKSDFKTIVVPVTIFASTTAPLHSYKTLPTLIFWIWLHVLHCALANQSLDPSEDAINKPDRPIPSGRVTVEQARMMRYAIVPICLAFSALFGTTVVLSSAFLAFFLWIYNECEYNTHWFSRNLLNGVGLACFEVGATLIACQDRSRFGYPSKLAIFISACMYISTIHAQDFKDVIGDALVGRTTLPMVLPKASRASVLIALVGWSLGLAFLWQTGPVASGLTMALALITGVRFVMLKSVSDDQKSFYLFNLWLSLANALPALAPNFRTLTF